MNAFPLILLICFLTSCDFSDKTVNSYKADKVVWNKISKNVSSKKIIKREFTWSAPKLWDEKKGNSIRIGSFSLYTKEREESADLSIVVLSGNGGGTVPNINRWRGQLSLPLESDQVVLKKLKEIKSALGVFKYTFLKNTDSKQGMLAAIYNGEGKTLFVKAKGSIRALEENEKKYYTFLRSIRVSK